MWQASGKLWVNGLKRTWFLKICVFFPLFENENKVSGEWGRSYPLPGPLVRGATAGGVIGSSLTCPTLTQAFPVSPWLVLTEGARPVFPPAHHPCQLPAHTRRELLPGQTLPTPLACLSGALQHRVAGSSLRAWGLFAFRSGVSSHPRPSPQKPRPPGSLCGCGCRHRAGPACPLPPGDPSGPGLLGWRWLPLPSWCFAPSSGG